METRCPYLGLQHSRKQALLLASPHHRCYASGSPERIATAFQAEACLSAAHRRCPRLLRRAKVSRVAAARPLRPRPSPIGDLPSPPELPPELPATESSAPPPVVQVPWSRPTVRRAELEAVARKRGTRIRRPLTLVELAVLGLSGAILLAFLFIGYAFVYRLEVGPGMEAPTAVAGAGPTQILATMVPTFTPTRPPTPVPAPATTFGPPTPIPEPTLPLPTPYVRTPAASPPTRLVIPALELDIPVLPVGVKQVWDGSRSRVVWADVPNAGGFHQTSAYPGNPGNTVINGHRDIQGAVFRHLDEVEIGDEITLYVGDEPYLYYVTETLVVPETFASAEQRAENLQLIGYMPEDRLTLVTCTPVALATHRLLVIAKPPGQLIPEMPEAGTDSAP